MKDFDILRSVYAVFLGILLALLVNMGIRVFYQPPVAPDDIYISKFDSPNNAPTEPTEAERLEYDQKQQNYWSNEYEPYERNTAILALVLAVVMVVAGISVENKLHVVPDGILLGGVFTLFGSVVSGMSTNNDKVAFAIAVVAVAVTLFLGYWKFTRGKPAIKK